MLIEIQSDVFRKKKINFQSGLNVILGDEQASNSIGKSNLLLIIDFIFGGSTYIKHSLDVVENIGKHIFYFTFIFDKEYKFARSTELPEIIYECDNNYNIIEDKTMKIEEFTSFLQIKYKLNYIDMTFRTLVSVYIRVWGKENYDEKKPLKAYKNDSNEKLAIYNLIRLFDKYTELKSLNEQISTNSEVNKTINAMYKTHYAQKISKTEYNSKMKEIEDLNIKIKDVKDNVLKYIVNIEELINKENIELKSKKNVLLTEKDRYENQLLRINKNLEYKAKITSNHIEKLQDFFPNINIKEVNKIETFHKGLKTILSKEIKKTKIDLEEKVLKIKIEINEIDKKISTLINIDNQPDLIVNELLEYSAKIKDLEKDTSIHKDKDEKRNNLKILKEKLKLKLSLIIQEIKELINDEISKINKKIDDTNNPPNFDIENDKYKLYKPNDTGTGTSKFNLVIFDLAILKLTELPLLIHDSLLFKDIGNERIENLINYYNKYEKQIFIAIDEHKKYTKAIKILEENTVIKLDKNNTLYNKIWNTNE